MRKYRSLIISGSIGNILENYDYILYANFAVVIGKLFFPFQDTYTSLLATFGVFAAGFITRPLGAIIFGHVGDKYGRKLSLSASIMLMSIPTAMIGILPTYSEVGILAPIFLILIRLLQGISIGGETSGFITYLLESAPDIKRKGFLGSFALASAAAGLFCGFLASFICNFYFAENEFAWKIPFLLSFPVGLIGFYIRNKLEETLEFKSMKNSGLLAKSPLVELFKTHLKEMMIMCGLFVSISVPFYIFFAFLSTFLVRILGYSQLQTSSIYLCSSAVFIFSSLLAGWLSDKFKIYKFLFSAIFVFVIFVFPIFFLILSKSYVLTLIGCICFIVIISFYQAPLLSVVTRIFPTKIRATGSALSFNVVSVIFGGFTPVFLTWLIGDSSNFYAIPFYLILSSMLTILTLNFAKRYLAL